MGAAVFGGFCFLLLTDGGRLVRRADPLVMQLDRVAERLGLGIDQASVSGHRMTSSSDIFKALNLKEVRSLVRFDSAEARRRIEALPWIEKAQVLSVLPNRLDVKVRERRPFAIWRREGRDVLVDRSGRVLSDVRTGAVASLPVIFGAGAPQNAFNLFDAAGRYPSLVKTFVSGEWIGNRRWTLNLTGGRVVHLPEKGFAEALKVLTEGAVGRRLIEQDFSVLDLRDPGQIRVRHTAAKVAAHRQGRR